MTRKENLLIETYNLRNQIAEIKGNKIVNIEEFSQTRKFRDEAAEWKEFELKLRIEELKKNLVRYRSRQSSRLQRMPSTQQRRVRFSSRSVMRSGSSFASNIATSRTQH